jgi:hypothetical protein
MRLASVALASCVTLSACVGNGFGTDAELADRFAGRTLEYTAPEGLPAESDRFHTDGTMTSRFRPWLVPERLGTREGWWWVESGRLCRAYTPRGETEGTCYDVTIDSATVVLRPWREQTLFQAVIFDFPDLRRTRVGRFID